jgi:hypothetical protein
MTKAKIKILDILALYHEYNTVEEIADDIISLFESGECCLEIEQELEEMVEQNRLLTVRITELLNKSPSLIFEPPNPQEAVDYILLKELMKIKPVDDICETAELFINYYESVGWVVGKAKKPMKSWKKALNNWCKRDWSKKSPAKSKIEESVKAYNILHSQKK